MDLPEVALAKLAELEKNEHIVNPTRDRNIPEASKEVTLRPITLLFTAEESVLYISAAEALYKQFKVDSNKKILL